MEKFKDIVLFILLFIWQLPQSLIGAIMLGFFAIFGGVEIIAKRNHCIAYKAKSMQGGISLGNFVFVSNNLSKRETAIAHELDGHTVDSKIFGPLYLLVVGLPSILNACFDFTECYYDFYTEKWANNHAGLGVDKNCCLYFKTKRKKTDSED